MKREDLVEELALECAAIEAFGGAYNEADLLEMVDVERIKDKAISLLDLSD